MNQRNDRPVKEFRAGTISASVWTKPVVVNGRSVPQHTVRIEKRFKCERTGEWRSTGFLQVNDLPRVVAVAWKAFEFATLRERDDSPAAAPAQPNDQP